MGKVNIEKQRSKYVKILCNVHKNIPAYVPFILIMKYYFTENLVFFVSAYLFRFIGIIIKCCDFTLSNMEEKNEKTLSQLFRNLTSYSIVKKFGFTNKSYIIFSIIIFILFLLRLTCYIIEYYTIKRKKNKETFEPFKFKIFMDHVVFLFFPFITEFLFLIYFIILYPDKFIIKKDNSYKLFNYIISLINTVLIIVYYLNGYIYMLCVNKPFTDSSTPIKYRYSNIKFGFIYLLQIFTLIECLPIYLGNNSLKWYQILTYFFLIIILIFLYVLGFKCYNYANIINYMLNSIACFCFISMLTEVLLYFFNYICETYKMLFCLTLIKILSIFFVSSADIFLTKKYLMHNARTELFKSHKQVKSHEIADAFLYINHLLKKVINKKKCLVDLMEIIILHQKHCKLQNCKCKLIQINPYGKNSVNKVYLENLTNRVSFFIESSFAQMEYANDYNLVILLCEHYHHIKNNSIMSYSMVQTLLNFQSSKLSLTQLINLYDVSQKYINASIYYYIKKSEEDPKYKEYVNSEKLFQETFYNLNKIKKIKQIMIKYSDNIITIIKYKEQFEDSIKITKDEDSGELKNIANVFMVTKNLNKIIEKIKFETANYDNLIKNIKHMNHKKNPIEYHYKNFLFFDFFFGGEVDKEIINQLYSWTRDRTLYSSKINPNIFILLYRRYINENLKKNALHSIIFKYSSGLKITYMSDSLVNKLSYNQNDLINKNIDILLPIYLSNAHETIILKYLVAQQTIVFEGTNHFMFDKNNLMYKSFLTGASLPGLKKNLLILCNIQISDEKKQLFFMLDRKFDLVSMSYNLTTEYNLTYDLIQEFDINFLKLFSIQKNILHEKFQKKIDEINLIKKNYEFILDYHFIGKLFKRTEKDLNKNEYKKINNFKLLDDLDTNFKDEEIKLNSKENIIQNAKNQIENIYNKNNIDQFKAVKFFLDVSKTEVIHNLGSYLDKSNDLDLDNENYRTLLNIVNKFKSLNIYTDYYMSKKNEKRHSKNKILTQINDHFNIECRLSLLYDTYYYIFKITEISFNKSFITKEEIFSNLNNKIYTNNNLISEDNSLRESENKKNKNKFNKKAIFGDEVIVIKDQDYCNNNSATEEVFKINKPRKNQISTESIKISAINHSVNEIISSIEKAKSMDKSICDYYIKHILFCIMLLLLIIYIVILFYQNKMITTSHDIFLVLFYDYYQRDKIIDVLSLINCAYISVLGFTNYVNSSYKNNLNITLFDIDCLLSKYSPQFEDSYLRFFQIYKNYSLKNNKPMGAYLQLRNVTKLTKDWKTKTYSADLLSIFQSISFFTNRLWLTNDEKEIARYRHDFKLLFHLDFEKELEKGVNITMLDNLTKVVYFLMRNYFSEIKVFLSDLQEEAEERFVEHSHISTINYTILEVLGILIYFLLTCVIIYYLFQNNKCIFGYILNIFLDFTQLEHYRFKNHKDNYICMKKITDIVYLVKDFSLKNLKKFNLKINDVKTFSVFDESSATMVENDNLVSNISQNRNESYKFTKEIVNKFDNTNDSKISGKNSSWSQSNVSLIKSRNINNNYLQNLNVSQNSNTKNSSTAIMKTNNSSNLKYNIDNNMNIKDKKLLKKSQKNNQKVDEILNENNLNIEIIKKKIKREGLVEIRNMYIIIFLLFIIVLGYTCIIYLMSYNFLTQIQQIFNDFAVITYQYSGMYEYFNALLIYLIMPRFADINFMENLQTETEKQRKSIKDIIQNRFSNFPLTEQFYNDLNQAAPEGENIHPHILEILCEGKENDYTVIAGKDFPTVFNTNGGNCKGVLISDYSLTGKGVELERDAITTEIMNLYNDFKKLENENKEFNFTIEFLQSVLNNNKKFYELDLNINVILNKIQEKLYNYFFEDQENIFAMFYTKINVFNCIAIGYCVVFIAIVLIYIILNLTKINKLIEVSSFRITKALCYIKLRNMKSDSL